MLRVFLLYPIVAGLLIFSAHAQSTTPGILEEAVNKFYSFQNKFPLQKIYIHTDKPYYLAGDNMYGKLYLVNENSSLYDSTRSKKIYVELIDEDNTMVKKTIVNGLSSSLNFSFQLNDSIAEGYYLLRAYTSWMIGINDDQNIFTKYIHISGRTNHTISSLSYTDSSLAIVSVQVKDTLKNVYATLPAQYQLIYKNKVKEKGEIVPGKEGRFLINVGSIPKDDRNEAEIKIRTGAYKKTIHFPALNDDVDLQFFAEGGNLVNEVENTVAFKAIDKQGHGKDVEGYVKDSKGAIVCRFRSSHLGMGRFNFIPQSKIAYTAYVPYGNGKELSYLLPAVDKYASQVAIIKRSKNELRVRVALGDSLYKKNATTYLVATAHGGVYFTSRGTDLYEVDIPLTGFPEGIARLTLFDSAMRPVSERLIYVHHPNSTVTLNTGKNNYRKREEVSMLLKITDPEGKQLKGIYSVAVTDDQVIRPGENEDNIKTHLLLSPYLKGNIEEPGYYFKNDAAITMDNLDLVMLTHGWSRFTWSDIESNAAMQLPQKDSSLSINGKLTNKNNQPARHYAVSLFSVSDNNYIGTDTTSEKGEFHFTGIDFTDSTSFFIQTKNRKDINEDLEVSIDPLHFPLTEVDRSFAPTDPDLAMISGSDFYKRFMYNLVKDDKILLLKDVTVSTTKRKIKFDESKRVSLVSHIITSDVIERYGAFNLMDLLYAVPGVTITDGHIGFFGLNSMSSYTDPLFILNGVENSRALTVNAHDIDFIEVLRGGEAAIYGMRGANGVVLVNTKRGQDASADFTQKGIKALQTPGYHVEKEFYSPRYDTEERKLATTNDMRTTIYWNGNVTTDSKTPAIISFYTADLPTTYTVTIEGTAENGEAIHQTFPLKTTRQ